MVPVERVQQRADEQIVGAPQFTEETVEAGWSHVNACNEQIMEVPLPQNTENVVQGAGRIIREAVESRRAVEVSMSEVPY